MRNSKGTTFDVDSGPDRKAARIMRAVGLLMMCMALGAGVVHAKKKKAAPPPADLPHKINNLATQLKGLALDESGPTTGAIEKLVLDHMQEWLAARDPKAEPSDVPVRRELEAAFELLHYPVFAWPRAFVRPWKGTLLTGVGYTLGWTDYERVNVVAVYATAAGETRLAAVTHFVPRTDLHYEFLPVPPSGDLRFILWGTRLGRSQPRLTAILYDFDGQSLKPLWQDVDAYDGRIDVGPQTVAVRYLREDEYVRAVQHGDKPARYEALYQITAQGLQLVHDHDIPF
ncbi:MAG TPA: hypothetical protein VKM93_29215 [Terriglobia bacterium]|nr:hypothetical protein [Terriglobia bacterium]